MGYQIITYIFVLVLFPSNIQSQVKKIFKVSVVEYYDENKIGDTPGIILAKNSENMANLISKAAYEGTRLIVFPEKSFSFHDVFSTSKDQTIMYAVRVPEPEMQMNLCTLPQPNAYSKALVKLSCAAEQYEMFVVINVLEKIDNLIFSSTIVFDNFGVLIAKCRKNLYTGKRLNYQSCKFQAESYKFALLMENELLSPDLKQLIGDADCVVYSLQRALNNIIFPTTAFYEMIAKKYKIQNFLVSAYYNHLANETASAIFTPQQRKYILPKKIKNSIILSDYIGTTNRVSRNVPMSENVMSTFIRSMKDIEIQKFKSGSHTYCGFNGLCCKISTLQNYEPRYFRVAIFNVSKDISMQPKYDKLREKTIYKLNFCGVIYCKDPHTCGSISGRIDEVPKIRIETAEDNMTPLLIGNDLTYELENPEENEHILEIYGPRKTVVIGFIDSCITYKKVSHPKENVWALYKDSGCIKNGSKLSLMFTLLMIMYALSVF